MKKSLGEKISEYRKNLGMTQENLAEKLGVSAQAVSKWENNVSCPDINMLPALANIFGITVDELLQEENKQDAYIVPKEERKDINKMMFKIRVLSQEGDNIKVNLPMAIIKLAMEKRTADNFINIKNDAMKEIDWNSILSMIEEGVMGKLIEINSTDGDIVEIYVE